MNTGYIVAIILLIITSLLTAFVGILKRDAMLNFEQISLKNAFSIKFWFSILTNPYVIGIFAICLLGFIFTMVVYQFMTADKVSVLSFALLVPAFLFTIFLNWIYFKEVIPKSKYVYLFILFISLLFALWGTWGYLKQ